MSVTGISSSSWYSYDTQSVQNQQQFSQDFAQLGQDLQSGNLSDALQDFVTLQQVATQSNSSSTSQSDSSSTSQSNSVSKLFDQLSQDLQSGDLSAAQQDFTSIQQAFQSQQSQGHHHHNSDAGSTSSEISQLFEQLGQDLQSGNLSNAVQAYSALQQDFQQFGQSSGETSTQSSSGSVSVTV